MPRCCNKKSIISWHTLIPLPSKLIFMFIFSRCKIGIEIFNSFVKICCARPKPKHRNRNSKYFLDRWECPLSYFFKKNKLLKKFLFTVLACIISLFFSISFIYLSIIFCYSLVITISKGILDWKSFL